MNWVYFVIALFGSFLVYSCLYGITPEQEYKECMQGLQEGLCNVSYELINYTCDKSYSFYRPPGLHCVDWASHGLIEGSVKCYWNCTAKIFNLEPTFMDWCASEIIDDTLAGFSNTENQVPCYYSKLSDKLSVNRFVGIAHYAHCQRQYKSRYIF